MVDHLIGLKIAPDEWKTTVLMGVIMTLFVMFLSIIFIEGD